jgi:hypothetical protein
LYDRLSMNEHDPNVANNPEQTTVNFLQQLRDAAEHVAVGVPVQVGLSLVANGLLTSMGVDISAALTTAITLPATLSISRAIRYKMRSA